MTIRHRVAGALAVSLFAAGAQAPNPPYALFQNGAITASGNTINATRVPVITQSGMPLYFDVAIQFNVDHSGNLAIANGFPLVVPSPALLTSQFKPGTYVGPSNFLGGKARIVVTGPGIGAGGATLWSLSAAPGADSCTPPASASWYVGTPSSGPFAARVAAAKITNTDFSYGIGAPVSNTCQNAVGTKAGSWIYGALLGLSQTGNTLTIASFTAAGSFDYPTPQDTIVFTLQ
jgi:hypothetical protein